MTANLTTAMDPSIFVKAAKQKLRFDSSKGDLTVEQLFSLPLTSAHGVSLDGIAREVNRELKNIAEDSFVDTKPNPAAKELSLKLEILKFVIADVQAEAALKLKKQNAMAERDRLLRLKDNKNAAAMEALSVEDLDQRLAANAALLEETE